MSTQSPISWLLWTLDHIPLYEIVWSAAGVALWLSVLNSRTVGPQGNISQVLDVGLQVTISFSMDSSANYFLDLWISYSDVI